MKSNVVLVPIFFLAELNQQSHYLKIPKQSLYREGFAYR